MSYIVHYCLLLLPSSDTIHFLHDQDVTRMKGNDIFFNLSHSKGWGWNGPKINLAHACPGLIFAGKAKIIVGLRTKCGSTQIGHCLDPKYYIRVEVSI
jgi:hypothetical protein